jgi:predicted HD phosphohydrolase
MSEEDQDRRSLGPVIAEPPRGSSRVREAKVAQRRQVHRRTLSPTFVRHATLEGMTTTTKTFTRMDESTAEEWAVIGRETMANQGRVADTVLSMLRGLADITDGFAVDQLTHCLQTATLAERAGADDEMVVASLCHDIGKAVSVPNHPKIAAEILKPYVREEVYEAIRAHQDFQGKHYYAHFGGDPDAREKYRGEPWFDLAAQFADEWDQIAFDPDYDTLPLEHFEPKVRAVFAMPKNFF